MEFGSGSGSSKEKEFYLETEPGVFVAMELSRGKLHSDSWQKAPPTHLFCLDRPVTGDWSEHPMFEGHDWNYPVETFAINLRDSGLSKTKNWRFYGADSWIAYLLGNSYLAMRTWDLIAVARALKAESDGQRAIHLHAHDEFVPVALHAAALEPELFESVTLHGGIRSWEEVIDSRDPIPQLHNVVHGALRHYDLLDLVDLIGEEKVIWK